MYVIVACLYLLLMIPTTLLITMFFKIEQLETGSIHQEESFRLSNEMRVYHMRCVANSCYGNSPHDE